MNRPLVLAAVSFLFGLLAAAFFHHTHAVLPLLVVVMGAICSFAAKRERRLRVPAVALVFLGAGGFVWAAHHADGIGDPFSRIAEARHETEIQIEGRVLQSGLLTEDGGSVSMVIALDTFLFPGEEPRSLPGKVLVRWRKATLQPHCGDSVRVKGKLRVTMGQVNPGAGGVEAYYRYQGVHTEVDSYGTTGVERLAPGAFYSPAYLASRLRAALANRLTGVFPEEALPFVYAVWLGERTGLSEPEFQWYVESGTAHMLSVSGVHVSIIFLSASMVLSLFIRSRRWCAAAGMGVVIAYALMTGASTPCVRAALMICIYLVADLLDRDRDAPTALSIAALIFLIWNPDLVFDAGFQLSFLSIASILLFSAPIQEGMESFGRLLGRLKRPKPGSKKLSPAWRAVRGPVATTLAVQILPAPMAVRAFHVFSVSAPLANTIVIPLLTAVLWLCFAASILCWFAPPLAMIFGYAAWPAIVLIRHVAEWTRVSYHVTTPTPWAVVFFWAGALACLSLRGELERPRMAFRSALACGLIVLSLALWRPLFREPEAVFLDVGHGDAAYICFPGGGTALVDAGERHKDIDYGARVVAPFLWSRGLTQLDLLFVSHPDSDHIGGAQYIVEHFRVGTVVLGPRESKASLELDLIAAC
ncbi:MAG: ComEC/Rec2 family competence protein, partial [Candidatus Hydrogenedentales bacterium]